ncbi:uncharacterized protein MONBRDRAFT_18680 [Monosiga brevicollis MX1]|uniref:LMBR1 domain-containing protein 2 n=1 Tax=Monosiga brevicollis TaxID=81824 RepID=A9UWY4_MONBE|nr:uncharacterized protein MONBRDRAFT_18680 [Monosiga brevicollis MX1]EDQ90121.1 predicted protein [Monosiga brevicollis MX1]|eukprot:XP_001744888.1 hypothetical protein [Monosiga brevicollis MX1]
MLAGKSGRPYFGWLVTLAAAAAALILFANMASPTVFVVDILVTLGLCGLAFRHYGRFSSNWIVTAVVLYTWFLSSAIVFVLPIDVSSILVCCRLNQGTCTSPCTACLCANLAEDCSCSRPWSYVSPHALPVFWKVIYWSSQALSWLILPIGQTYFTAGDFTPAQKLKTALRANAVTYVSLGVIAAILLIYIAIRNDLDSAGLEQIIIAASNTWGLLMVVLMLGYGVVDIPRLMWRRADIERTLRLYYYRVASINTELIEAEAELDTTQSDLLDIAGQCPTDSPLRAYLNLILLKCPAHADGAIDFQDATPSRKASARYSGELTQASLADLHAKVIKLNGIIKRCNTQRQHLIERAIHFEDVKKQRNKADHKFSSTAGSSYEVCCYNLQPWEQAFAFALTSSGFIRPVLYLAAAVFCTILSLIVVWSEVLFFTTSPTMSIYALLLNHTGDSGYYFNIEVITFFTLFYLSVCTYRVVFKLRIFDFYQLVPHQQTDSASLIFSGLLLCRLTAPLGLNFLSMSHLDAHVVSDVAITQPTAFTRVMGHMDVVAFIKDFATYYPISMLIVSLATLLHIGPRLLSLCGFSSFISEDDDASDTVTEGRALVRTEKRTQFRRGPHALAVSVRAFQAPLSPPATPNDERLLRWQLQAKYLRPSRLDDTSASAEALDDDEEETLGSVTAPSSRVLVRPVWFSCLCFVGSVWTRQHLNSEKKNKKKKPVRHPLMRLNAWCEFGCRSRVALCAIGPQRSQSRVRIGFAFSTAQALALEESLFILY